MFAKLREFEKIQGVFRKKTHLFFRKKTQILHVLRNHTISELYSKANLLQLGKNLNITAIIV